MWLSVPTISCPSALELADSSLGLGSQSQALAQYAWWRGKSLRPQGWRRVCKMEAFTTRLSGLTLPPSILNHGADLWIASLREIPVSPTVSQESSSENPMTDGCSITSSASSKACGLLVSSERTCRGTRMDNLKPSSQHWKDWVTALRLEYSQRQKSAPLTDASDCSLWPTIRTSDTNGGGAHGTGGPDLRPKVDMWPTMRANDAEKRGETANDPRNGLVNVAHWETPSVAVTAGTRLNRGGKRSGEMLLSGQAVKASQWPTVRASDGEHGGPNQKDSRGGLGLTSMAYAWPTPMLADCGAKVTKNSHQNSLIKASDNFSLPPLQTPPHGLKSSDPRRLTLRLYRTLMSPKLSSFKKLRAWTRRVTRRKLNPSFVDWMQGWPNGWTDLDQAVTGLPLWLRHMRGELSKLVLKDDEAWF